MPVRTKSTFNYEDYNAYLALPEGRQKQRLLNKLLTDNEALVRKLVQRFLKYTRVAIDPDDAHQCGLIGFMIAVRRFNPEKGKISTYAGHWINWELRQAALRELPITHPRNVTGMPYKVHNLAEEIEGKTGKPATAEQLGTTEEEMQKWRLIAFTFEGVDKGARKLIDDIPGAEETLISIERERALTRVIDGMTPVERSIVLDGQACGHSVEFCARVREEVVDRVYLALIDHADT